MFTQEPDEPDDQLDQEEQKILKKHTRSGGWDPFMFKYIYNLRKLLLYPPADWTVMRSSMYREEGVETIHHTEFETLYTAKMLSTHYNQRQPATKRQTILDIGSYKQFVIGLTAAFDVTMLDVRLAYHGCHFQKAHRVILADAKDIPLDNNSQSCIISLCTIEHCGLGRYGDEFDLDGDVKVFDEMKRVLAPGGLLIFSTTVSNSSPVIFYNAHRVYTLGLIHQFCSGLDLVDETYFNHEMHKECTVREITKILGDWSLYCGTWRKPK